MPECCRLRSRARSGAGASIEFRRDFFVLGELLSSSSDPPQHIPRRDLFLFRLHDLAKHAGRGRGDFHRHLVGLDLDQRLVLGDGSPTVLSQRSTCERVPSV